MQKTHLANKWPPMKRARTVGHRLNNNLPISKRDMTEYFRDLERPYIVEDATKIAAQVTDKVVSEVFYAAQSFKDYLLESFLKSRYQSGVSVRNYVDAPTWIRKDQFTNMLECLVTNYKFVITEANYLCLKNDEVFVCFEFANGDITKTSIYSEKEAVALEILSNIEKFVCNKKKLEFEWIYDPSGRSISIIEEYEEVVSASNYPFIEDFNNFANKFLESKSNILILQGPPGTGKTTFIKNLMSSMNKTAYVTYDPKVLANDHSFAQYMGDEDAGAFIIEDADNFLGSRANGNDMVSRFLNVGDGLIKLKDKKLIFSTNLPNLNDIDQALLRPGRCYGIINFRPLTRPEAEVVAKERSFTLEEGKTSFTLAEIFNSPIIKKKETKFGFC